MHLKVLLVNEKAIFGKIERKKVKITYGNSLLPLIYNHSTGELP